MLLHHQKKEKEKEKKFRLEHTITRMIQNLEFELQQSCMLIDYIQFLPDSTVA